MGSPTREDAQLIVQIAQWGTSLGLEDAVPTVFAGDFDPDSATLESDEAVRKILLYGESIGTLTKHDLLSRELVADWLWVSGLWSRVGPAAVKAREKFGEPRLYENFELLAKATS
jgi:hypothetical protein